jgi:plasmid maintenance system killer protein
MNNPRRALARFFATGATKGINAQPAANPRRVLTVLNAAEGPET